MSIQVVRDADYKAPRARRAALRRTASGKDPFAEFNFLRPPPREAEAGGGVGRGDLEALEEEEEEDGGGHGADDTTSAAAAGGPLQMQWEFEVRDGWEAFGPVDQRELARACSTGQKQVTLHRAPTDGSSAAYSYRLDLQKMTQVNLGSGRQRKLRRLPAGRSPDALDAAAGTRHIWGPAAPELTESPGQIQSPREEFQGWAAGEGGEEEVVGDVDGRSDVESELVLLSSTAPVTSENRTSAAPR
eukprot:COSAG02_NODE_4692_length_5089_cov_1.981363_2_plen_245_part_00